MTPRKFKDNPEFLSKCTDNQNYGFISFEDAMPRPNEHVLVTNNLTARNVQGRMSHLWLTTNVFYSKELGYHCPQDMGGYPHQLSHWKYAFERDVIDILDPNRTDVSLCGTVDANITASRVNRNNKHPDRLKCGCVYLDRSNNLILINSDSADSETVRGSDGIWRYNRYGDVGRVTGSKMDFSHDNNLYIEVVTQEFWADMVFKGIAKWMYLDKDKTRKEAIEKYSLESYRVGHNLDEIIRLGHEKFKGW